MKTLTLIISSLAIFFFFLSCDQNDNGPEEIDHFLIDFTGYVQKGPFIVGSSIIISELSSDLEPTGRVFPTQIDNNTGKFELPNVELESQYVQMKADGFYFNERTGELSETQLTFYSLVDITDLESFNINVLSHLEKDRIVKLMEAGMEFMEAKRKAKNDVLGIFDFVSNEQLNSEQMNIASAGDDNAILLAVSIILQGDRPTSEFSELMSQIILDIREDGVLDNESLGSDLINGVNYADLQKIRFNTEERYDGFGIEYEIPDFEKYIDQFISNTTFLPTNQFTFPEEGTYGTNVLPHSLTEVEHHHLNDRIYSLAVEVPERRSLTVKIIGEGVHVAGSTEMNMSIYREIEPIRFTSFTTTSSGLCDVYVKFLYNAGAPILTMEYYEDENTTPSFVKQVEILTDYVPVDSTLLR